MRPINSRLPKINDIFMLLKWTVHDIACASIVRGEEMDNKAFRVVIAHDIVANRTILIVDTNTWMF